MTKQTIAITRAVGVIGATIALVTGITFANLSSSATLTASSISTATAELLISNGGAYGPSQAGFTIIDMIPGIGNTRHFYLKNNGGVALNVTAHIPVLPSSAGFSGWGNVIVTFHSENPAADIVTDMAALNAGNIALPGNALGIGASGVAATPGTAGNYTVKFDILPAAITGSHAQVDAFDLVFTGTQP